MQSGRPPHFEIEKKPKYLKYFKQTGIQVALIVFILLGGMYVIYASRGSVQNSPERIIYNAVVLRDAKVDTIKKSVIVTQTDDLVGATRNKKILADWKTLSRCLQKGCQDADFFNFILTIVEGETVPHSNTIVNLIRTYKYWNSQEDLVKFSKAMSAVNDDVEQFGGGDIDKQWGKIVACNGSCTDMNSLYFSMIKMLLENEVSDQ